ncbi:MAG: TIGR03984 family CRISPR-associated protein [Selenomonadaceae bacterium]|nr:TIGR03984 family CRISPR-associated protein [Selenomonadaceae bacterium]
MSGLDLSKEFGLTLVEGEATFQRVKFFSAEDLESFLREKFSDGIFVAWQIQSVVWGTFDGEKFLLKDNRRPNFNDWLECRIFNRSAELHLKRDGQNFVGRYLCDTQGEKIFHVDSFARLWGECTVAADGWLTLHDKPRKILTEIPCDDFGKKFYGLLTRNYIGSDAATGLSGYVDYRFVAIESAWDGD